MFDESLEMIELELAILIRRTTANSTHRKFGNLDRSGYLLLRRVATRGPAGVKVLAGEFQLDISTISRQTSVLEHKGYFTRIPDPLDGRAYSLQITEEGLKELNEYRQARLERVSEITVDWTEEERNAFGLLLKKFNQSSI